MVNGIISSGQVKNCCWSREMLFV